MILLSGLVADKDLKLKQVAPGMWVVINAYKGKYDFFARSPLFKINVGDEHEGYS